LALVPLFLLLFTPIRKGRLWLIGLCLVVLLGKLLEFAWLVLPTTANADVGAASLVLATVGLFALALATLQRRPMRRPVAS
jgi:hypothetical protein